MWVWLSQLLEVFVGFIPRPHIVRSDHATIEFVLGRPRILRTGWYIEWPLLATYETIAIQLQTISRTQRFGRKAYRWKLSYRIGDPLTFITTICDSEETIADIVEITVGDFVRTRQETPLESGEARALIRRTLKKRLSEHGVDTSSW